MIEIQSRDLERVQPLLNSIPKEVKKAITRSVNLRLLKVGLMRLDKPQMTTIKARDIKKQSIFQELPIKLASKYDCERRQLSRIRFKVVGRPGPSKSIHQRLQIGTKKSKEWKLWRIDSIKWVAME